MKPEVELLLWSVEQIAEACGLSQGFVKKEIREGRLVAQKVGRLTRVSAWNLQLWIANLPEKNAVSATVQPRSLPIGGIKYVYENPAGGRS